MGKTKFVFDDASGTLKPESNIIVKPKAQEPAPKSSETNEVSLDLKVKTPNVKTDEPIIQFRQNTDYTIFQVIEERTKNPMMVIGGYGLEIKFNISELRTTERIEQLLGGLNTMFRKLILEQALSKGEH